MWSLGELRDGLEKEGNSEKAGIFGAHQEILQDPELLERADAEIDGGKSAAFAWRKAYTDLAEQLASLDNEVLAGRATDVPGLRARGSRRRPRRDRPPRPPRAHRLPLTGPATARRGRRGDPEARIDVGMRTGDTPGGERARLLRRPPQILITTPESLFLMLTSRARETLQGVRTVIVDEVHAVAGTKRGAHLAVSLERLDAVWERFTKLKVGDLEGDEDLYREMEARYSDYFEAFRGAEAIKRRLESFDLQAERDHLVEVIESGTAQRKARALKRIKVINAFLHSGTKPTAMVLDALPVIPPDLRPMVQLDGGRFAPSALHDPYGFPIDLTLEMAAEQGVSVDEEGFRSLMAEQKERARADESEEGSRFLR